MFRSRFRCFALSLAVGMPLLLAGAARATTLYVPAEYVRVQMAIDAAANGDVVLVQPGTYREKIDFKGKGITVKSTYETAPDAVSTTIIDGTDLDGSVVSFKTGETTSSRLLGFTICNGVGTVTGSVRSGGGIYCSGTSPLIAHNHLSVNTANYGAGVYAGGGSPRLTDNVLADNWAAQSGGGICCINGSPILTDNNLNTNHSGAFGGGIYCQTATAQVKGGRLYGNVAVFGGGLCFSGGTAAVTNCLLYDNIATGSGGGLGCRGAAVVTATLCTISHGDTDGVAVAGNSPLTLNSDIIANISYGHGLVVGAGAAVPTITYCDFYNNAAGNFSGMTDPIGGQGNLGTDPRFVNAPGGDFRLRSKGGHWNGSAWVKDADSSRCIDAADPALAFDHEPSPDGGRANAVYDGNTSHTSKTPPPEVITCGPKGSDVSRLPTIFATFSVPMKHATVESALYLNTLPVTGGTFTWSGNKMMWTPGTQLTANKHYQVKISTAAKSKAGVSLEADKVWTFTTGATTPPLVTAAALPRGGGAEVRLNLCSPAEVCVTVRNLAGREIAVLEAGRRQAGVQSVWWNGRSRNGSAAPAGTYVVEVRASAPDGQSCRALATFRR